MNNKNKGQPLFRAAGFFLACLLAALFLFAACDSPLDDSQLDNSPGDNSSVDNDGPPAQDNPPSQDPASDPPSDPPPDPPPLVLTVTFDKNGGATEAEPSQISVTWPDNTVELPASPSGSGGLVFRGWNTNADGSGTRFTAGTVISESITVYARWGDPFETMVTDVADVAEWLSAQPGGLKTSPVNLVLDIDLGDMADGSAWYALLDALAEAQVYVALDLSDCTMTGAAENGTVFRPNYAYYTLYSSPKSYEQTYTGTGKGYIVELTLPLHAKKIYGGWSESGSVTPVHAFWMFNSLAKIRGDNIEAGYAETGFNANAMFYGSSSLKEARFEKLTEASRFFYNCQNLESVSCPSLANIGYITFYGCKSLKTFDFSNVKSIENASFGGTGLVTLDLGQTTITKIPGENGASVGSSPWAVPMAAFQGCSNLETIIFPASLTDMGKFKDYIKKPSDPPEEGGKAFGNCSKIKQVTFLGDPAAIDWRKGAPPYDTGLEEALITLALSGSTPQERIGTYVKNGGSWSKQ